MFARKSAVAGALLALTGLAGLAACSDGAAPPGSAQELVYLEGAPSGGRVVRVAADGSHRTVLFESVEWVTDLFVAPDGRILINAFDGWRLLSPGGSPAVPFTLPDNQGARNPVWAPDGQSIVWSVDGLNSLALAIAAPGNSTAQIVTPDSLDAFFPAWSPNGERLAFVGAGANNTYNVYSMNRDGSDVRKLTPDSLTAGARPAWSHSGNQVAFTSGDVWIVAADGSGLRRVTTGGASGEPDGFSGSLYWAPDDRSLMATSTRYRRLYRIRVADGQQSSLGVPSPSTNPLSPDATRIVYLKSNGPDSVFVNRTSVVIAASDGSNGVVVSPDSVTTFSPVWLPAIAE